MASLHNWFEKHGTFSEKVLKWIVSGDEYNEALCRLNIMPLCYQLAKADIVDSGKDSGKIGTKRLRLSLDWWKIQSRQTLAIQIFVS